MCFIVGIAAVNSPPCLPARDYLKDSPDCNYKEDYPLVELFFTAIIREAIF